MPTRGGWRGPWRLPRLPTHPGSSSDKPAASCNVGKAPVRGDGCADPRRVGSQPSCSGDEAPPSGPLSPTGRRSHNRASRFQHLAQLPAHAGAKLNVSMNEDRLVRWLRRAELQKNKKIILNRLYLFLFLSSFRFTGNLTGNERDPIHPLPPPRRGGARYRRRRRASIPGARRPRQGSDKRVPTGVRHPGLTQSSVPARAPCALPGRPSAPRAWCPPSVSPPAACRVAVLRTRLLSLSRTGSSVSFVASKLLPLWLNNTPSSKKSTIFASQK